MNSWPQVTSRKANLSSRLRATTVLLSVVVYFLCSFYPIFYRVLTRRCVPMHEAGVRALGYGRVKRRRKCGPCTCGNQHNASSEDKILLFRVVQKWSFAIHADVRLGLDKLVERCRRDSFRK